MKAHSKLSLALLVLVPVAGYFILRSQVAARGAFVRVPGTEGATPIAASMWKSPHEVVAFFRNRNGRNLGLHVIDERTGVVTPLNAFNAKFPGLFLFNFGTSVSPDGKWLLWASDAPRRTWTAARLDGTASVQRPRGSGNLSDLHVRWLPDSSGWVERYRTSAHYQGFIRVCRLRDSKISDVAITTRDSHGNDLWMMPNGDAILVGASGADSGTFHRMSLSGPDKTPVPFSANFNNDQMKTFYSCALSPKGDRFAWLFQTMKPTRVTASVWISDLDGKNMRRVTRELDWGVDAPTYLHWNPDGKRVSYWRQNALWTTPVD